jgi:hypothetical protein
VQLRDTTLKKLTRKKNKARNPSVLKKVKIEGEKKEDGASIQKVGGGKI